MLLKRGLAPIADGKSRVLILGSLPGDASLQAGEYYAHPRNHFWRILSGIHNESVGDDYESKQMFLRQHGISLWDVLKEAERRNSLDSNIRASTTNDLETFFHQHPQIRSVGLNGTKAWKIFNQYRREYRFCKNDDMHLKCLPSSSPTPGRNVKSFEEKLQIWGEFLAAVG